MEYLDQTTDDIRLFLVEGDFNKDQFKILKEDHFSWKNLVVNFGILGESHFINLTNEKNESFTEICACTDAVFNSEKSTLHVSDFVNKIGNLPVLLQWDGFAYAFDSKCIEYARGERGLLDLRSVRSKDDVMSLEYKFPAKWFFQKKPVTEVYIKKTNDSLFIRTAHTYPNDKLAVFTNSALRPLHR